MMMPMRVAAGLVRVGDCELSDVVVVGSKTFAKPKSSTFTVPSARTLTFAGFKSR